MKFNTFVLSLLLPVPLILQSASATDICLSQPGAQPQTDIEFVMVKGGCFQMGNNLSIIERPVHEVCVSDFSIGKYEVTRWQWQTVMGYDPTYSQNRQYGNNCPVEGVSWNEVQEFLAKLNNKCGKQYRLPTEAEWEYAARSGGKTEKFSGGADINDVAWHYDNSGGVIHPVGQKKPNGLGIYDMNGNVPEWCSDWYGNYVSIPQENPQGPSSGKERINRGGGWYQNPKSISTSCRDSEIPSFGPGNGFRLVAPVGDKARQAEQVKLLASANQEYSISQDLLVMKLGNYNHAKQYLPISIKNKPFTNVNQGLAFEKTINTNKANSSMSNGVNVTINGNIPLSLEAARTFGQHFNSGLVHPDVKVKVGSGEVAKVVIVDFFNKNILTYENGEFISDTEKERRQTEEQHRADSERLVFSDPDTDLMWVRDGNIAGDKMKWEQANTWVHNLNYAGYNDWRFPTVYELLVFFKKVQNNMSSYTHVDVMESDNYWTSDENTNARVGGIWTVSLWGRQTISQYEYYQYMWPVRAKRVLR